MPPDADKLVGYVAINASDMPLDRGKMAEQPMTFLPGNLARVLRFTLDGKLASAKGVVLDKCRLVLSRYCDAAQILAPQIDGAVPCAREE